MPKAAAKKKPVPVNAPPVPTMPVAQVQAPPPQPQANGTPLLAPSAPALPVVYDELLIQERSTASPLGPLSVEDVEVLLDWETEKAYQARMMGENPGSKPEAWIYGEVYHCLDTDKQKVRCWRNAGNRPFDQSWCDDLIHTILYGQWAGPHTIPGETVNCEIIRISKFGRVISGQHQMTALKLADEWLQKSRAQPGNAVEPKFPAWNGHEHPFIETLVSTGMSEDPRVLQTVDYVKPRTVADMLYTMELYRDKMPVERKEMTRILSSAIDVLWNRTETKGYKTHPEVVGFLERHKRLLKCVEHLFTENRASVDGGRKIGKLRLSPGQCSALCYLMGSNQSDATVKKLGDFDYGDVYRNESPPSERNLDWSYWDRAREFWARLGNDSDPGFDPVRVALRRLVDSEATSEENQGLGGRNDEKLAILAAAWDLFRDHNEALGVPFSDEDLEDGGALCLHYSDLDDKGNKLPPGEIKLIESADFHGIDSPQVTRKSKVAGSGPPEPPAPTREEIEKAMEEAAKRRAGK